MKWIILTAVAVISACATGNAEQASGSRVEPGPDRFGAEVEEVDSDLEARFANVMREPILLDRKLPSDGLRIVLARQLNLYRELGGEYADLAGAVEGPEERGLLVFRRAQIFVRLGCSIIESPAPNQLAEDQIEIYRGLLRDQAMAPLEQAASELEDVPSGHSLSEHAANLRDLPDGSDAEEVDAYCTRTGKYWRHPQPTAIDVAEAQRCDDGDPVACYVWAELGSGGAKAESRACELGVRIACPETRSDGDPDGDSDDNETGIYGPGGPRGN